MENVSKTILIAGAVLIVLIAIAITVILIGIGEDNLNNIGEDTIDNAEKIYQLNKFMKYEGQVTGAQVKQCIAEAIAYNSNLGEKGAEYAITIAAPVSLAGAGTTTAVDGSNYMNDGGKMYYVNSQMDQKFNNTSICRGEITYRNNGTIEIIRFKLIAL